MFTIKKTHPTFLAIHTGLTDVDVHKDSNIFAIYDAFHWKLTNVAKCSSNADINTISTELQKFSENQQKPWGVLVSSATHIELAEPHAKFLYLPGEVCRQSDVLKAAVQSNLPLVIEKGAFLAPSDLYHLLDKVKDAQVAIIECGTAYGYSDRVLDPRTLLTLKNLNIPFGLNLSDLDGPEGVTYPHQAAWLKNSDFLEAFIQTGKTFGVNIYVYKTYGHSALIAEDVLKYFE